MHIDGCCMDAQTIYNRVETERVIPKLKLWIYMRIYLVDNSA